MLKTAKPSPAAAASRGSSLLLLVPVNIQSLRALLGNEGGWARWGQAM